MYSLVRSCQKTGFRPQMILPSKNYSATHNRSHFALKYRIEPYGSQANQKFGHSYLHKTQQYHLPFVANFDNIDAISNYYSTNSVRYFRTGQRLYEQPSSKVEVTVQTIKNKQKEKVEEIMKEAAQPQLSNAVRTTGTASQKAADVPAKIVKKPLKTRIWEELVHYYHGFRLLFIDFKICHKLLWQVLNGKTLTRRENKLLLRTTSDMFRLIPFSVFIIVPFLEFTLPVFLYFFPNMLPTTFQTAKDREDKLRQSLQVRLEMAKFLQKTLDEMAVQHKDHRSEEAKQFDLFFQKIKNPNEYVSNEEIIKFAKHFEEEYTLDSLSRQQLAALCRVLELNAVGTTNFLRYQLRVKLRNLAADDRVISREGVNSLDLWELQQACKARGMRAYGLTQEKMRTQLQEWIDLSLNDRVPPILLLLSRTIFISDDSITTDKLKETLRVLPDTLATQTKAAIGESEGKIDNKTKIEIIQEECRKINEEHEEEREHTKATEADKAPVIDTQKEPAMLDKARVITDSAAPVQQIVTPIVLTAEQKIRRDDAKRADDIAIAEEEKTLSSKDVELLSDALKTLSPEKKMVVEKEALKDLKEELAEYKEDVEELCEVRNVVKEPIHESRAAKMLFKKVNTMISQLDKVVLDLEQKQKLKCAKTCSEEELKKKEELLKYADKDIVQIDELIQTIKRLKNTSDESRLKQIENVLCKLDADKDGAISVDEVLKVVEAIGRDNVKLNEKQLEELICLLDKEQIIEAEEKIEKALARSIKEADEAKKMAEEIKNKAAAEAAAAASASKLNCEELVDRAGVIKDKAMNLDLTDKKNIMKTETYKKAASPKVNDPCSIVPPTTPTKGSTNDAKGKMM